MSLSKKLKNTLTGVKPKYVAPKKESSNWKKAKGLVGMLPFMRPTPMSPRQSAEDDVLQQAARNMAQQLVQQREQRVMEALGDANLTVRSGLVQVSDLNEDEVRERGWVSGELRMTEQEFGPVPVHNISGAVADAAISGLDWTPPGGPRPENPRENQTWLNEEEQRLYVFAGGQWLAFVSPAHPDVDRMLNQHDAVVTTSAHCWHYSTEEKEKEDREAKRKKTIEAKHKEYFSNLSHKKIKFMTAAQKSKLLRDAERYAKNQATAGEFCNKCKRTGWITTKNDYRAKHGKAYAYSCPDCNPGGRTL